MPAASIYRLACGHQASREKTELCIIGTEIP